LHNPWFLLDARLQTLDVSLLQMPTSPQSTVDLPGIKKLRRGKVREVFDLGDTLLFVVTDRIWAFDVILPDPIPHKGAVLNQISAFWFKRFDMISNHLITADFEKFPKELQSFREQLAERSMIVKKRSRSRWNAWCAGINFYAGSKSGEGS
jgi:phosphoribosylaminoimidazole-succinocarboxamide synthase